ncbi:MAG TPA: 1-acyl-sn-glycerol-3-phosphate acyltransferase, partial [Caldimonas sp.]|nr:1-acyl-sn-glycerol-3-phosphate acyltransferase [Caldimonas sp.]
ATHAVSLAAEFIGATSLLESLWRTAGGEALVVRLDFLTPLPSAGADRRALAGRLRDEIGAALEAL